MAKNVLSLQLLRNSTVFTTKELAIEGITGSTTQDGVIKLARYTEGAATKTIFGIYHDFGSGNAGYTIYDSYQEAIAAMQDQINAISGATSGATEEIEEIKTALGTGVTTANTVTDQLEALSGDSTTAQSSDTSVEGAKKYAEGKIAEAIDGLDNTSDAAVAGQYITHITESNGIVSAGGRADIAGAVLNGYQKGSDSGNVVATDTINQALSKLEKHIEVVSGASTSGVTAVEARLGDGVTSANTAADQLAALSGNAQSTSADTSVEGAKKYADGKVAEIVDGLDYTDTAVTGSYVSKVDEADGVISVTREALPTVAAISEAGKPITAVSESLGAISATAGTINAEYVNVADSGNLFIGTTVEAVLAEIDAAYKAADTAIIGGASESANTLGELEALINSISADAKEYHIVKTTTGLPETVKESYSLVDAAGNVSGDTIDIPKDSHIVSITYNDTTQKLTYTYIDASGNTQSTDVDMSELILETEFASGITVTNHIAHGVVDSTSEKDSSNNAFLTVGADGFKIQGIKAEIAAQIGDVTDTIEQLSGKTITTVSSSNSSISATTGTAADGTVSVDLVTDASKVKMTGFTADASGFTGITEASTVTQAVKAIETEFLANEATVSATLNDLEEDKLENIVVNGVSGTVANKIATVTVDGSQLDLSSNYAKAASNTPVATGDSVDVAIGKLEKQIEDATAGGLQAVDASSGITVSAVAQNRQTITAKLTAAADLPTGISENAIKFDSTNNGMYVEYIDAGTY